ncbi:hypothetical protein RSOLAG22IIIB_10130 [Rhizoctonia solani]|uniref:AMP-dependent synthetase/ligase domain-containing protein n=1 Tax=Rhizoctonia solani TaxID=456999 RepID=A0A0K6G2F9_9AGAM|nr:hypothetical protein RSOLAG22IIIB_10130 [Rhizoctonia solani]
MTAITPDQHVTHGGCNTGPLNDDPLTENELAVLLAIPRGAEKTPNATIFRLPLGPDPSQGWVDVSFSEARSIIARLAIEWKARLSAVKEDSGVGPGMTISLLVQPVVYALFHWLAFWALGCSIQLISLSLDEDSIALCLKKSGCQVAIYSGISEAQVEGIRSKFVGTMVPLSEEEQAHRLAQNNKNNQADLLLPWPEPQRPDPAIITHSSGSTGAIKLFSFSLYFYTLNTPKSQNQPDKGPNNNTPNPRPMLIFSPPYWQSFNSVLIAWLAAGIPVTFPHVLDIATLPSSEFISWVQGLDVGATLSAPRFIRDILASGSEYHISSLQALDHIFVGGSALDSSTAALAEKYKLNFTNGYGCTELGKLMATSNPPYTHLHPLPGSSPLVHPVSDPESDGSRQVQIWYSRTTSSPVSHLHAKGGVPLRFEPFPGEGPHNGELAVRIDDIFKEVRNSSENGSQVSYVYLGRSDDLIKLAGTGGWGINASAYETELISVITPYLARTKSSQWVVDGVQLFGNNRPRTALVIQLRLINQGELDNEIGQDILDHMSGLVELVNDKLKLDQYIRVNSRKRMVIVTPAGKVYGPGKDLPRLMTTHKNTLQRWRNVELFGGWLDELDYSEL